MLLDLMLSHFDSSMEITNQVCPKVQVMFCWIYLRNLTVLFRISNDNTLSCEEVFAVHLDADLHFDSFKASSEEGKEGSRFRDDSYVFFFLGRVKHTRNAFKILMCMLYALLLLWLVIFYFVLFDTPCVCVTWEHVSMCKFILHHCLVCEMSIFVACEFCNMSVKTTKLDQCQGIKLPQSSLQFIHAVVPAAPLTPVFFNGISIFGVPGDVAASSRRSEDSPTPVVVWKGPKVGRGWV